MKLIEGRTGTHSREISQREIDHRTVARRVAADGIVLLKNNGVLPLQEGASVALYGAAARHTIMGGTGSGMVNSRPGVSVCEGLVNAGFTVTSTEWLDALDRAYDKAYAEWKQSIYDMSVPGDFNSLYTAHSSHPMQAPAGEPITATGTDTVILVISRVSGEGADRHPVKGDYYLSDIEEQQLTEICAAYEKVIVVLNVGGVIDLGFTDRYPIAALVQLSQPGMEGGNALADVLSGKVNPSGRLTETWAMRYEDYPCAGTFSHMNGNIIEEKYKEGIYVGYRWFDAFEIKPRYPFGYGLSYTDFKAAADPEAVRADRSICVPLTVTNTGKRPGKTAFFLFAACPDGLRKKEHKRLIAFAKTPLLQPGESAVLTLEAGYELLASWHAGRSAWYLDKGVYRLFCGSDAERISPVATLTLAENVWGEKQHRVCPLLDALPELQPTAEADARRAERLNALFTENLPVLAMDTQAKAALDEYTKPADLPAPTDPLVKKLTLEEKACLVCGRPKKGDASFIGDAAVRVPGAAAETTPLLEKYGIPATVLADGPAGIRIYQRYEVNPKDGSVYSLDPYQSLENRIFKKEFRHEGAEEYFQFCTAIPVGTMLAQSFDPQLVEEIGGVIAREMKEFGVTWWLAPGMNIKRNPLCGRNFEYYSEDPLVAGRIAAAITRGVQATPGAAVTIKHYACNNQEDNRRGVNSVVSERALREIYLKGFEIAIREAQPWAIMTSYNRVNGVHTANSRDLCTVAAREEWGFRGIVMTDWTTTNSEGGASAAKCVEAGNDLTMPGLPNDIHEIMDAVNEVNDQSLSMADLDACCARILTAIRLLCC
ncbi:MAG: glycoside hydrolase family 3 C-terminal domain-containing protein [Clostridia bacterium]|nr:glycoside hydrolase family 3 C-terminal domain-containing protein [Clostridia bacterium]